LPSGVPEYSEHAERLTVGIVGGMGPLATAAFYRTLTSCTPAQRDQDHLHVVIESDPAIPDRTAFLLGEGPDPRPAIIQVARRLAAAGAELLVMPCNTANVFAADVAGAIQVPLVPWIETAGQAVAARGAVTVGILATSGTLRARVYQNALDTMGLHWVVPRDSTQRDVMAAIYGTGGVKADGRVAPGNRQRLLAAAAELAEGGAEVLLLACTELPLAIPADDPDWPLPVVDPATEVARKVVALAAGSQSGGATL
jgi:aspartate racemase